MSRMKSLFAVLCLAAVASVAPQAHAQVTLKVMIAGSSGVWQAMGVGTFKAGACPTGSPAGCAHYTNSKFNLNDTRPTLNGLGGTTAVDGGNIWIVWDNTTADPNCATACDVWAYVKVDSTVGARCYFAQPHCNVNIATFPAASNIISSAIWGADSTPPAPVQALFTAAGGVLVNVAATDIRPEDTLFAQCRANSALNATLTGLGYNANNVAASCPAFGATLAKLEGSPVNSAFSTSVANNLAFAISGKDPFTGTAVPVSTPVAIGAVPVVFVIDRQNSLAGVTDASLTQLQTAFSGTNCVGNVFTGGTAGNIDVYLREPLSGTMNTAEYTALRFPRNSAGVYAGQSQETGVNPANANNNPLNLPCTAGGSRLRAIGTGEEVAAVSTSTSTRGVDGIGYTFFSYGNVSSIANSANFAYLTVNGVDPIFQVPGTTYDPGQPATAQALPAVANLPASCAGAFPCSETVIWKGKLSFPNVRNGSYRQWSIIRLISNNVTGGGQFLTNAKALITSTQQSAVSTTPDFIPAVKALTDPGLDLYRSHYTQTVAPVNGISGDKGGEVGGCIIAPGANTVSAATKVVQRENGCVVGP